MDSSRRAPLEAGLRFFLSRLGTTGAVMPFPCDVHCLLIGRACRVFSIWWCFALTLSNQILHTGQARPISKQAQKQ